MPLLRAAASLGVNTAVVLAQLDVSGRFDLAADRLGLPEEPGGDLVQTRGSPERGRVFRGSTHMSMRADTVVGGIVSFVVCVVAWFFVTRSGHDFHAIIIALATSSCYLVGTWAARRRASPGVTSGTARLVSGQSSVSGALEIVASTQGIRLRLRDAGSGLFFDMPLSEAARAWAVEELQKHAEPGVSRH